MLLVALATVAGCTVSVSDTGPVASSATPEVRTLSPLPLPLPAPPPSPATGRLYADLRQSSRDAALGRMQVWVLNDTERDLMPTRITYADARFPTPVPGERLRLHPARSERGYPLALPRRPDCSAPPGGATLTLAEAGGMVRLPVEDPTDIVARHVASRCLEVAVARVASVGFADRVPSNGSGVGGIGSLVLVVAPTGHPGRLTIDSVAGTPVLAAHGQPVWRPGVSVRGGGQVRRIELPVVPARCDPHAFAESGGATAFRVRLRLDGRPGELVVRMSPRGAAAAIDFAMRSCGLGQAG